MKPLPVFILMFSFLMGLWTLLSMLVHWNNQCGAGKISLAIAQRGVFCVSAERWKK